MPEDLSTSSARLWDEVAMAPTPRGPIEYARAGSGPCVLVIHGTPGSWRQALTLGEDLAPTNTVISPSRPGYGRTRVAIGRTYAEQADAFAALLEHLNIDRALVVGASGGGPPALSFAERHPAKTAGLVLACAMAPHMIDVPLPLRILTLPLIGEVFSRLDRMVAARRLVDDRAIDARIAKDCTPGERARIDADPSIRAGLIAFARTHLDAPAGLAGMRNDLEQVRRARAAGSGTYEVTTPVLVLHGDADTVVSMEHAHHHAKAIAGAELEVYDEAGHIFFVTRRAEASERIRAFAAEHLRSGS